MRIEREPIDFDETNIIKETIQDLADDSHLLLSELICNKVIYADGLEKLKDYEIDHVTDLLVEEVSAMLYEFANSITKEEVDRHIFDIYNK